MTHHANSVAVAAAISNAGIPARAYASAPLAVNTATLRKSQDGKFIRVWMPTNADYTLTPSPNSKHALLKVKESDRVFPDKFSVTRTGVTFNTVKSNAKEFFDGSHVDFDFYRGEFGVAVARGTKQKFVPDHDKTEFIDRHAISSNRWSPNWDRDKTDIIYSGKRTIYAGPAALMLLGVDESKPFISFIKNRRAKTVADALKSLIPRNVDPTKCLRQGEWFFKPLTPAQERKVLIDFMHYNNGTSIYVRNQVLESGSSHRAELLFETQRLESGNRNQYAFGCIRDGREGYHADLNLKTWHQVIRNNEVVVAENTRYYD